MGYLLPVEIMKRSFFSKVAATMDVKVQIQTFRTKNQKQPPEVFYEKSVLKKFAIFTGKHLCWRLFFHKETPTQVISCKYCEIFKNIYCKKHLRTAASVKIPFLLY